LLFDSFVYQILLWLISANDEEKLPMNSAIAAPPAWQDDIFSILKEGGVRQVAYVPDAGHSHVIRRVHADPDMRGIVLTTEEEGVATACGAWLGGERAVLLMQSSGVGNCVNMFSLIDNCRFPFLALITMRGEWAEFNQWQSPMGKATQGALELMGITVLRASRPEEVADTVSAAFSAAFDGGEAVAVLLSQSLIGRKKWEQTK
jgi:sulfopyruvate decarboxylase alpha subunit